MEEKNIFTKLFFHIYIFNYIAINKELGECMEEKLELLDNFVHLARIALSDRKQDVQVFLHRIVKRSTTDPKLAKELMKLLRDNPTFSSPLRRGFKTVIPADTDTRFQLLRFEERPHLPTKPVYTGKVQSALNRLVEERKNTEILMKAGLEPTRTILFTGPPGVGKTLSAQWMARQLNLPLMILDLSAVMSSYLGRTGTNLRYVLDYAKSENCILLLDELDAIAKRRDDAGEIGELKRLVTVLLQQLDDWPSSGLLIAATNHSDLLDPAVWRRFEQLIEFDLPDAERVKVYLDYLFEEFAPDMKIWTKVLAVAMAGRSYSDIERDLNLARREAALKGLSLAKFLTNLIVPNQMSKKEKINIAVQLVGKKLATQRKAHEITGVSRETIRTYLKNYDDTNKRI